MGAFLITLLSADSTAYMMAAILALVIAILPIILFFKVWGMCNDIRDIKELMKRHIFDED